MHNDMFIIYRILYNGGQHAGHARRRPAQQGFPARSTLRMRLSLSLSLYLSIYLYIYIYISLSLSLYIYIYV